MNYTTIQKNISDSPRKLRLVADMVRKMNPDQALEMLSFTNRAAASPLAKAIKTAIANSGTDPSTGSGEKALVFKKIEINEGMKMKRNRVGTAGRGRSRPYRRRMSHIKIVLTDEIAEVSRVSKVSRGKKDVIPVSQTQPESKKTDSTQPVALNEAKPPVESHSDSKEEKGEK